MKAPARTDLTGVRQQGVDVLEDELHAEVELAVDDVDPWHELTNLSKSNISTNIIQDKQIA